MKSIRFFLLLIVLSVFQSVYGQIPTQLTTKSKKAAKLFKQAGAAFEKYDYPTTFSCLEKAIKIDPGFIEAYIFLGDLYVEKRDYQNALRAYKQAVLINADFFPPVHFNIGQYSFKLGLYQDALKHYVYYLNFPRPDPKLAAIAERGILCCEFSIWAMAHPVPFNPVNLGDSINSGNSEYVNALTADEKSLYYTVRRPSDEFTQNKAAGEEEDFYYSENVEGIWQKGKKLGPPLNTHGNEGALSISPDGTFLIFTGCERPDGLGSCDLYISYKNGNIWTVPVNMGSPVNTKYWETHASIASDGKSVYFVSTRPGGKGNSDIYITQRLDDGTWSMPFNLGDSINTPGNEMYPYIHPDNKTLFFSSDGHIGMGGLDLFVAKAGKYGFRTKPHNLGYPINSHNDEIGVQLNTKGNLAYFSSEKPGGRGKMDIYSFELYPDVRPVPVTYMKGVVFDAVTNERLSARFELIDLESGQVVVQSESNPQTGEFLVCIPTDQNYALNVSKNGYLFYSDHFELEGIHTEVEPFLKNVPLQKISIGQTVVLRNIFFDTDKYDLKPESVVELQKLVDLLKKNPGMKIEISGHTDSEGSDEHNRILSENRAKAVYDFLVKSSINPQRLTYKGYGESQPIDTNDTPQGRANNRRTEFKVIAF